MAVVGDGGGEEGGHRGRGRVVGAPWLWPRRRSSGKTLPRIGGAVGVGRRDEEDEQRPSGGEKIMMAH